MRRIVQAGLQPASCRLLDPVEALTSGSGDGSAAVLVLAFEASEFDPEPLLRDALEVAGGARIEREAGGRWRDAFLRLPYVYEEIVALGLLTGTFETAVTWDRFPALHDDVSRALARAGPRRHRLVPARLRVSRRPRAVLHARRAGAGRR